MARILNAPPGPLAPPAYLRPRERVTLDTAPRKTRPGTTLTVRSYDIPGVPGPHEHQYTEYDDGREQFIFRGGPGPGLRLRAQVDPATQSPDYGRGGRVLYRQVLPRVTAQEAKRSAEATRDRINREDRPYLGAISNSNYANSENVESQTGYRVGDHLTPGWRPSPLEAIQPMPHPFLEPVEFVPRRYRRPPRP